MFSGGRRGIVQSCNLGRSLTIYSIRTRFADLLNSTVKLQMKLEATKKTAFLTGIWSALGFSAFGVYENLNPLATQTHNILFIVVGVLFLFIPFLFIVGSQYLRFGVKNLLSKEYFLAFRAVTFRRLFWFFGGAISLVAFRVLESYFAT